MKTLQAVSDPPKRNSTVQTDQKLGPQYDSLLRFSKGRNIFRKLQPSSIGNSNEALPVLTGNHWTIVLG